MNIGTAKPSIAELSEVPHYFINSHSVTEHLSTADFERLALQYLDEIFQNSNTAVVCGGTGLYIKSLCEGIDPMPDVDKTIESAVNKDYEEKDIEWLQQTVKAEDPEFYKTGEIHNPVRLIRALVFKRSTGKSIMEYRTGQQKQRPFDIVKIALEMPREVLYARINKRMDTMMEQGLLDEVKSLYPQRQLKNLQTVGYTELFDYMDGKYDLQTAIDKIKQHTRNYAKRQLTWFRKDEDFRWLAADDPNISDKILGD